MIQKIAKSWPIIAALAPIVAKFLLVILIIILIMVPFMYFSDIIEVLHTSLDKFVNFTIGEGFKTSDQVFFSKLDDEFYRYDNFSHPDEQFDIALIAATIHYYNIIDPEGYDENKQDEQQHDYEFDEKDYVVGSSQLRDFYAVAVKKLGSAYTLKPTDLGLLGHLVDTRFEFKCVEINGLESIKGFFNYETDDSGFNEDDIENLGIEARKFINDLILHLGYTIEDTTKSYLKSNIIYLIREMWAYHTQGQNFVTTTLNEILGADDLVENFIRILGQSSFACDCSSGEIPFPIMVKFNNYDWYKKYLENTYLKQQPYNTCNTCKYKITTDKKEKESILKRQVEEIFDQRDAYKYLMNKDIDHRGGNAYIDVIFTDGSIDVVYFNQDDSRWINYPYTFGGCCGKDKTSCIGQKGNIGGWGCGPTSLAMVVSSLTGNIVTPIDIVDRFCPAYCYDCGSALSIMIDAPKYYGLKSVAASKSNEDLQKIINALSQGSLVIARMGPGTFTRGGHFIVLRGITSSGQVLVADPKMKKRSKAWSFNLVVNQAKPDGPFWIISN